MVSAKTEQFRRRIVVIGDCVNRILLIDGMRRLCGGERIPARFIELLPEDEASIEEAIKDINPHLVLTALPEEGPQRDYTSVVAATRRADEKVPIFSFVYLNREGQDVVNAGATGFFSRSADVFVDYDLDRDMIARLMPYLREGQN